MKKKIILCGYNWAACCALEYLLNKKYKVFVFTHRSNFFESDLISYCKNKRVKYSLEKISKKNIPFKPDLIASIYYRFKIPENVLNLTKYNSFNLHTSLLPKYRGCSSIPWAMINNEKNVGFTYHYMNKNFDTGNIILQKKIDIKNYDLQSTLYYRVMFESLKYLEKVLRLVFRRINGRKQNGKGFYYGRGVPYNAVLNKNWPEKKKKNFIKAMIFPPKKCARYKNKSIKSFSDLKMLK
jgi:methionyl-tRNA formyltransferase